MKRPKASVLPEAAMVPERNLLDPPPNKFTHEVKSEQPYYYGDSGRSGEPAGTFPAGTPVLLVSHDGGAVCHVVDGRGLYVSMAFKGLRPLE